MSKEFGVGSDKRALYHLYVEIFNADISFNKQCYLLDDLYRGEPWAWNIVGITKNALGTIVSNQFSHTKSIHRDHFHRSRRDTCVLMLKDPLGPLSYEKWWQVFLEGNDVIMVTKTENDKSNYNKKDIINMSYSDGLFVNKVISFRYTNAEREYLKTLAKKHGLI